MSGHAVCQFVLTHENLADAFDLEQHSAFLVMAGHDDLDSDPGHR